MSTTKEMMQSMENAFLPEKAGSAKALIQLNLTGEDSGLWVVDIAKGQCQIREEKVQNPDVTVTMDANEFEALYHNKLNPVQAFMSGKIKVAGNVGMVMQLLNWFQR
ncbi:MAG: SCP2 sterol-binding domain-containing protein [Anaerolineae bacterium]|jgi:putative sterol carrier protein